MCTYRDIPVLYLLYTPNEWLLRQLVKTCKYMAYTCTNSVYSIYMYIHCTWLPHILCMYHYSICHCVFACTAFDIGMYNAIVQESTIVYIQEIPGCWDNLLNHVNTWHIRVHTMYIHVHTLYMATTHSLRTAPASLCLPWKPVETTGYTMYIHCIYMYIQWIYMYIHWTSAPYIL